MRCPRKPRRSPPLALADIHAARRRGRRRAVDRGARRVRRRRRDGRTRRRSALLQRGRTHNGQVYVVTQSVADVEALTGQVGLLASLSATTSPAFLAHRQVSPESRDWLAKLMGTTALWSSTDQTAGHGALHTGAGTRRRVREFRVASDTFAQLRTGEAVIHTTLGPPPAQVRVTPVQLPDREPPRITGAQHACETPVPTVSLAPASAVAPVAPGSAAASPDAPRRAGRRAVDHRARPTPPRRHRSADSAGPAPAQDDGRLRVEL